MPAFYSQQRAAMKQGPLTPPDSGSGYSYSTMHYAQEPYVPQQSLGQPHQDSAYDYQQGYMQPAVAPPAYQYQPSSYQAANSLPPIQSYYEPMAAPILPSLRIQDRASFADDYQRRLQQEQQNAAAREQQRQAAKEEKATGGVSAKLDYDMDRMTDFVTWATQSIFKNNVALTSPPAFRKWVHQVLSATRLPSATILLSLHYLHHRLENHADSVPSGENQVYRLLAVALILGSKFLDDNTFINRSWSDVTSIKVVELNHLEMAWLKLINYNLHVDPLAHGGVKAWLETWHNWVEETNAKTQQQPSRLSPLNTNVHRHSSHRDRYSPYPSPYSAASTHAYETPQSSQSSQYTSAPYNADPWAPNERHAYEDFYKRQQRYPTLTEIDDVNRRASEERARQSAYAYPPTAPHSYYQPPPYSSAWDQHSWNGSHRYDCNCAACAYQHHYRPYPMNSTYSAQTVMG